MKWVALLMVFLFAPVVRGQDKPAAAEEEEEEERSRGLWCFGVLTILSIMANIVT